MEISVFFDKRVYSYVKLGSKMTWVDEWQVIVPSILHKALVKQALDNGVDPQIFSNIKLDKVENNLKNIKREKQTKPSKKKKVLTGGINPFKK